MKTSKTKTRKNGQILLALAAILVVSWSCNFPLFSGGGAGKQDLAETIRAGGLVFPEQITVSDQAVTIEYAVFPADSPELIADGWLNTLLAAYEAESGAETYQLVTSLNGVPYMDISASKIDLAGFADEELSVDEFLERLVITDRRPANTLAWGLLTPLELELDGIDLEGDTLVVSYWPGPSVDESEVMAEWWAIFKALAALEDKIETIEIRNLYLDGSVITVRGETSDLLSFVNAGMGDLEYLAALEVELVLVDLEGEGGE